MITKLGQLENTINITSDSFERNRKEVMRFVTKSIVGQKEEIDLDWLVHLKTVHAIAISCANDIGQMFEKGLDMNSKRRIKKYNDVSFQLIKEFKKYNNIEGDLDELYMDYTYKLYEIINKFTVACYEGKDDQFMESLKFFKGLNSNGKKI